MTPHARRLLLYTMTQGAMSGVEAMAWLDQHTPGWREHNEPQANRCYDGESNNNED